MAILYLIVVVLVITFLSKLLKSKRGFMNFFFIFLILFLVVSVIIYPESSVKSALEAVNIWLFVVIPSLFPFFIGAELLIHSGVIDFIGIVLEPIMYPLFRVPGSGSFVFAMSVTSGYPVGASLVSELRIDNSISRDEAQRLVSLSSTSGPLFMIGAVAVGMLKNPLAGVLLSLAHYASAITIGILFRYYGSQTKPDNKKLKDNYMKRALGSFVNLKNKKLKSISVLISESIESAFKSLFMIGGFIIIYSVIIEVLNKTNIIPSLAFLINSILPFKTDPILTNSILSGLLELTNGCKNISALSVPLILKLCIISFLIGWGGLSVHSQAMSFMSKTDIDTKLYLITKFFHGVLSSIYTYLLYVHIFKDRVESVSVSSSPLVSPLSSAFTTLKYSIQLEILAVFIVLAITLLVGTVFTLKSIFKKQ